MEATRQAGCQTMSVFFLLFLCVGLLCSFALDRKKVEIKK